MSNALYNSGRVAFAEGNIDWTDDTIKVVAVTSGYTFSQSHDNLDDVVSGNRVATGSLASKTDAAGVLDAADLTFSAVTGSTIVAFIVYKDTGTESTSPLIAFIDHDGSGSAISFTPNGSDLLVTWNASGIATI